MKCEDVLETLTAFRHDQDSVDYRRAEKHLQACELCRHAAHAVNVLHDERRVPVPEPRPDAFVRAVRIATERPRLAARSRRRSFWLGAAVGGALAAGLAVALVLVLVGPGGRTRAPAAVATVTAALNEVHSVDLELETPRPLEDAEIRLALDGDIELDGYEGRRQLSWRTDLDAGANQLSLPVIVRGAGGGRVRVVVRAGEQTRTFSVDVQAAGGTEPLGRLDGTDARADRV